MLDKLSAKCNKIELRYFESAVIMGAGRVLIRGHVDKKLKSEFLRHCGREVWENGRPVRISQNQLLLIFLTEGVERRLKVGLQRTDVSALPRRFASASK